MLNNPKTTTSSPRPLILVTNDDGINAPGIHLLAKCMPADTEILIVAPDFPHSGQSSAITVRDPLRITRHPEYSADNITAYSVNGTPVDCVKLAMHALTGCKPDLVVAGINHGSNAGTSVIYSGTMGAVFEGCMQDIPSIGYSLLDHSMQADFTYCLPFVKEITAKVIASGLPERVCLNVNFPANVVIKGAKVVAASHSYWTDEYKEYTDPHGHRFYMLTGELINQEPDNPGTDLYWLERDYATIVPATPDQNEVDAIPGLKGVLEL